MSINYLTILSVIAFSVILITVTSSPVQAQVQGISFNQIYGIALGDQPQTGNTIYLDPYLSSLMFNENVSQTPLMFSGHIQKMQIYINRNTLTQPYIIELRKNGSDNTALITVQPGQTGLISSTLKPTFTNSDLLDFTGSSNDQSNIINFNLSVDYLFTSR